MTEVIVNYGAECLSCCGFRERARAMEVLCLKYAKEGPDQFGNYIVVEMDCDNCGQMSKDIHGHHRAVSPCG